MTWESMYQPVDPEVGRARRELATIERTALQLARALRAIWAEELRDARIYLKDAHQDVGTLSPAAWCRYLVLSGALERALAEAIEVFAARKFAEAARLDKAGFFKPAEAAKFEAAAARGLLGGRLPPA